MGFVINFLVFLTIFIPSFYMTKVYSKIPFNPDVNKYKNHYYLLIPVLKMVIYFTLFIFWISSWDYWYSFIVMRNITFIKFALLISMILVTIIWYKLNERELFELFRNTVHESRYLVLVLFVCSSLFFTLWLSLILIFSLDTGCYSPFPGVMIAILPLTLTLILPILKIVSYQK